MLAAAADARENGQKEMAAAVASTPKHFLARKKERKDRLWGKQTFGEFSRQTTEEIFFLLLPPKFLQLKQSDDLLLALGS